MDGWTNRYTEDKNHGGERKKVFQTEILKRVKLLYHEYAKGITDHFLPSFLFMYLHSIGPHAETPREDTALS